MELRWKMRRKNKQQLGKEQKTDKQEEEEQHQVKWLEKI